MNVPHLRIEARPEDSGVRLCVTGEIDLASAADLRAALQEHLAAGPVVADLSGVSFMDSTGVHVLDEALRSGGALTFVGEFSHAVRTVLELTGLIHHLPLAP